MNALLLAATLVLPPVTTPTPAVRPVPVLPRPQPVPILVQPVVVHAPAPTTSGRTWIPGRYVDQILPNGQMLRVWVPGHWM